jgi:anti-sigma B factor antagonist
MSQMALSERNLDGTPALALAGELNVNSAPDLRRLLMKYVNRSKPKLLLDLTGLSFMDTSGLATLIEAHLKAEKNGGMLAVFGLAARITEVFAVTRVTKLFHIFRSEEEALAVVRGTSG